ncbi:hypothetical protein NEMIN01_0383 [Nematocida minor]|uniref:uncharacterized protein n=1 Tax=Nematocida minor TaxID=1912983 RepID=UPI00221F1113|nr:uncharacterized protein NEMIN01_0383 [Nematocida minor]KAI5189217.1 hypothetical protein NEMIN01_0383 [Nematocida minor]
MAIRELREHIEKLIAEDKYKEIEEVINRPETDLAIQDIYRILVQSAPEEMEVIRTLNKHSSSYVPYLVYADYLVRKNRTEESIEHYQTALKVCKDPAEVTDIMKMLVFAHLQCRDLSGAFYTGWSLIEARPTHYNLRLVRFICELIEKSKLLKKLKLEAEKTKRIINESLAPSLEIETEHIKEKDIEIVGNPGIKEFLQEHHISIDGSFEVGYKKEDLQYTSLLDKQKYNEFVEKYHENIVPSEFKKGEKKEVDLFKYLIKTEDILLLYKIANTLYINSHYNSASTVFNVLIEQFNKLHHLRSKFMQLATVLDSRTFLEIFLLSPAHYNLYTETVKKHNISIYLVTKGKSKDHPFDEVFHEHFADKLSHQHYNMPSTYKNI